MPSKEQILKAAKTSPQAKEVLKELYPELFPNGFDVTKLRTLSTLGLTKANKFIFTEESLKEAGFKDTDVLMAVFSVGESKGFWLSTSYDWEIVTRGGTKLLIPSERS